MSTLTSLLSEYGESHQNETNKAIHWICVPLIFFSIVALIYSIPTGILETIFGNTFLANWAVVVLIPVLIYYFKLSRPLAVGMLIFATLCITICYALASSTIPLWLIGVVIFLLAWIGQFYGHKIEGKKPSFLKDLQFLLIGPAWLMHFLFEKWGIRY